MVRFLAKLVEKLSRLVSFSGRVQESLPRFLTRLDGFSPRQYLKFDIFWLKWTYLRKFFLQSSSFYSNWILRNKKSDDFQNFWSWWCLSLDGSLGRLGGNLGSLETKCSDLDGFQDFTYCSITKKFFEDLKKSFKQVRIRPVSVRADLVINLLSPGVVIYVICKLFVHYQDH